MLRRGQRKTEKYLSHIMLKESNISDPMLDQRDKFPNTENTIRAKNFLFAKIKTARETVNDTPSKNIVIHKSTLGSPKNNIFFFSIPCGIENFARIALN